MIDSRIVVTMDRQATTRTIELPFVQRHLDFCSTSAAPFTATSCFGVLQKLSTACYSFVGQHLVEPIPTSVEDMLCERVILDHSRDIESFSVDDTIFRSELMAEFMEKDCS